MKTLTWKMLGVALALAAALGAGPARAEKGAMEIGLAARPVWPTADLESLEPAFGYGAIFHYWLTSTTTVDVGIDYYPLTAALDYGDREVDLDFTSALFEVGLRYRPKLDFLLIPYAEVGLGYQFWSSSLDLPGNEVRRGNSIAYYGGVGFDWRLSEQLTAGVNGRYTFLAMQEQLEDEVLVSGTEVDVEKTDLVAGGLVTAGVELTWRFK